MGALLSWVSPFALALSLTADASVVVPPFDTYVRGAIIVARARITGREPVTFDFDGRSELCGYARYRCERGAADLYVLDRPATLIPFQPEAARRARGDWLSTSSETLVSSGQFPRVHLDGSDGPIDVVRWSDVEKAMRAALAPQ